MSATGPYGALAFAYDGVGNRLTYTASGVSDSYSYPPTSNRLSGITLGAGGARSLGYDGAGNVVSEDRNGTLHSYSYDAAGRLSALGIGGSPVASYRYDAMGRQVIRTLPGGTIHSIFDSQGRRIAEYDEASGALIREYVWMDWDPVAVIEGGVVYYVRADHIGRPAFATDVTGAVVWSASYLPFGEVRVSTGALPPMRFPGQWFQSESGLHQNWMRDYDPTTGRYIQADPLGLVDGASVYGYALQNPGRWTDPRGEQAGPKGTSKVPGTGFSVRIDKPTQPNQKLHAHIYDRNMCQSCVINNDGSPSHKSDPKEISKVLKNKKLSAFLVSKGFRFLSVYGLLEYCLPSPAEIACAIDPIKCRAPRT